MTAEICVGLPRLPRGAFTRVSGHGPRPAALRVLLRVSAGGFSGPSLDEELSTRPLEARDRGLCTELVYGTLRQLPLLDYELSARLTRPLAALDPVVLWVLRLGAYQLRVLGTAPHAAVDESVSLARLAGKGPAATLVNAVLRRLAREGPRELPRDPLSRLALQGGHPEWLVRRWARRFGERDVARWMAAAQAPRATVLRTNRTLISRDTLLRVLEEAGVQARPHPLTPRGIALQRAGAVTDLPGYAEGWFAVQDAGSQWVVRAMGVVPGERVVDACAGQGTKSCQILEDLAGHGQVVALDVRGDKLDRARAEAGRLGLSGLTVRTADATSPPRELLGTADAVLLDAPCSNLGVVGRHPEVRWRRTEAELAGFREQQVALLRGALSLLRPGGRLLYAVCSLEPEETVQVLEEVGDRLSEVRVGPLHLLFPPDHDTDGFALAVLRR